MGAKLGFLKVAFTQTLNKEGKIFSTVWRWAIMQVWVIGRRNTVYTQNQIMFSLILKITLDKHNTQCSVNTICMQLCTLFKFHYHYSKVKNLYKVY